MSGKAGRIKWLDILKGLCIVFVMLSHSYPPDSYRRFFTPFFITMFFFASGYTFSPKSSLAEFLKGKLYHLVLPLLLLGSIRILGMWVLSGGSLAESFKGLLLQVNCNKDELWFVSCLFTTTILFYLIFKFGKVIKSEKGFNTYILVTSFLLLLLGFSIILVLQKKFIWQAELALIMLFYYSLGYVYKKKDLKTSKWLSLALFVVYMLLIITALNDADIHKEEFGNPVIFFVSTLLIILPIIDLSKALEKFKISKGLIFLGENTLFYFAFSGFVREIFMIIMNRIGHLDARIESVICTLLMIIVLIIPAMIVNKYIPFLVGGSRKRGGISK